MPVAVLRLDIRFPEFIRRAAGATDTDDIDAAPAKPVASAPAQDAASAVHRACEQARCHHFGFAAATVGCAPSAAAVAPPPPGIAAPSNTAANPSWRRSSRLRVEPANRAVAARRADQRPLPRWRQRFPGFRRPRMMKPSIRRSANGRPRKQGIGADRALRQRAVRLRDRSVIAGQGRSGAGQHEAEDRFAMDRQRPQRTAAAAITARWR